MLVDLQYRDQIAVLVLDNASERNSLSSALVDDLMQALSQARVLAARALVIGGAGPAFCAGANIKDLLASGWMKGQHCDSSPVALFRFLVDYPKPVIAAVNGMALGGGFELCLSCDLVVASDNASFALPEAGHGVIPNSAIALLPQIIGRRRAIEWMMTRRRVSAREALELGLVSAVVPAGTLLDAAVEMAETIVRDCSPGALKGIKQSMNRHMAINWEEVNESLARLPKREWQEGLSAFLEHRKPDYDAFWSE